MQIIRGLHNLRPRHRGCVATIGNFDGVHLGHKAVFRRLSQQAAEHAVPATVITFEPQPLEFFTPDTAPPRLTRLREKLAALHHCGIERVVVLEFNRKLARMEAHAFVQELLVDGLNVRYLLVGDDFRFGRGRRGDMNLLRETGAAHGFGVENLNTFAVREERVSSTRIREALIRGDLELAEHNLGRPYTIRGRVAHGHKRGRSIGFPTANLDLHRRFSPVHGVFAVKVFGLGDSPRPGVANIGNRPTVQGDDHYLLEAHLFDFDRCIYGAHLEVEFVRQLRDEKRFESFEHLRQQIQHDAAAAREIFGLAAEGTQSAQRTAEDAEGS